MDDNAPFGRMQLQRLSLADLVRFGDHLFVEHPEIDAQHRTIFDLGTGAYENWRCGGGIRFRLQGGQLCNSFPALLLDTSPVAI